MRRHSRKKNSTKVFTVVTIVAALIFFASYLLVEKRNRVVVAKVNNQEIFKSDIEKKLRNVFEGQNFGSQESETKIPEIETLPKEVIEILAKEVYLDKQLIKEAKKSKISGTPEIKDKIANAQEKILRQAYLDDLVKKEVTDQKISEKYAELSNELSGKKEYLVSHIVSKTKEDSDKILKELKSKKSPKFSELAKKYSVDQESAEKGGELGYIVESNMIKEIIDAISGLKKDEVSNPIQTKFGWHLIKILDIRDAKALPFETVKENIREQLSQDKLSEINSKITKDVKVTILVTLKTPKEEPVKIEEQKLEAPEEASSTAEKPEVVVEKADATEEVSEENANKSEEAQAVEKSENSKTVEKKSNEKKDAKKQKNNKK
jgi:peptidyl-prolyl cis-trans isomerase C